MLLSLLSLLQLDVSYAYLRRDMTEWVISQPGSIALVRWNPISKNRSVIEAGRKLGGSQSCPDTVTRVNTKILQSSFKYIIELFIFLSAILIFQMS